MKDHYTHTSQLVLIGAVAAILTFGATISCGSLGSKSHCQIGEMQAPAGNCVEDLHCLELEECTVNGRCTALDGECVTVSEKECSDSENCKQRGECTVEINKQGTEGVCVASDSGCRQSHICAEYGKCSVGRKGFCIVADDSDCQHARICTEEGRCTAKPVISTNGKKSGINACQM